MRVHLAGIRTAIGFNCFDFIDATQIYALESFVNIDKTVEEYIPKFKGFLLDSGAFTFFGKKSCKWSWEEYVDRYSDFIKRNNVQYFFELDIDVIVGYDNVLRLRNRLEKNVGRQSIPVWHKNRGKDEYIKMCEEYPYVAIGGLVGSGKSSASEYSKKVTRFFPWFIDVARKNNAKIHALGYTSQAGLLNYHFDSVDSTSWISGNKFGSVMKFNGEKIVVYSKKEGQRMVSAKKIAQNNFAEWVKLQKWAETHL